MPPIYSLPLSSGKAIFPGMDFDASNAQHRGAARKAFWDTLLESRAGFAEAAGKDLGAPAREEVEGLFQQWLASMGIPGFPYYPK
jgi:hypothetical protein